MTGLLSTYPGSAAAGSGSPSSTYYVSASGNDNNSGTRRHPFKTITKINTIQLRPGDSVLLQGGEAFTGTLRISANSSGSVNKPVVVSSSNKEFATIDGGNAGALIVEGSGYLRVSKLQLRGSGRKAGNQANGLLLDKCAHIAIDSLVISGFQKAGILVNRSSFINLSSIHAYQNGFAGILIEGSETNLDSREILIADCLAENNPGDPTNLNNHSGNGILVGHSAHVIIEYCVAANNGWDMPRTGNGPVGIWCYESNSVNIRYCISHDNKTAKGADDGGGFDFDGGVTNSVIQHCLSYNNHGSAFGIFQYAGASPWHHNIIRNNISENDGAVSAAHAAVYIWNSTGDSAQFTNLSFYNNIIFNAKGAAIHYADSQDNRAAFTFHDNVFVAKDVLISGNPAADIFSGNTWWSLTSGFNADHIKDFKTWAAQAGKEQKNGKLTGRNIYPDLSNAGNTALTDPHKLNWFFSNYQKKLKTKPVKK